MTLTLYAQPYDIAARGFFFDNAEAYANEVAGKVNTYGIPVEEFEIQFIDGDLIDAQLFNALQIGQANIATFFDIVSRWDDHDKTRVILALEGNIAHFDPAEDDPEDLDIDIYEVESLRDLAEQFVEEGLFGDIPEHLAHYIDYDAIARDLAMDYSEASIAGKPLIYRAS